MYDTQLMGRCRIRASTPEKSREREGPGVCVAGRRYINRCLGHLESKSTRMKEVEERDREGVCVRERKSELTGIESETERVERKRNKETETERV